MRRSVKEQRLDQLEGEFRPSLMPCLADCAAGRLGLFEHSGNPELARYSPWEEATQLKTIALEIRALRAEFGQPSEVVERFLHYCALRGANIPGEPKLAKRFLDEIQTL